MSMTNRDINLKVQGNDTKTLPKAFQMKNRRGTDPHTSAGALIPSVKKTEKGFSK